MSGRFGFKMSVLFTAPLVAAFISVSLLGPIALLASADDSDGAALEVSANSQASKRLAQENNFDLFASDIPDRIEHWDMLSCVGSLTAKEPIANTSAVSKDINCRAPPEREAA